MDFDYCQGNSTIILSFERETGKWSGCKGLAGICEFGETDYFPSQGPLGIALDAADFVRLASGFPFGSRDESRFRGKITSASERN